MIVRAIDRPDGGVAVLHLNPRFRHEGESEADFVARFAPAEMAKCGLAGRPFVDVDGADLPERKHDDGAGKVVDDRAGWVVRNGRVEIEPTRTRELA